MTDRDALANALRNNPRRGRRPRVRKLSMLLHQGSGYRVKEGYVEIIGGMRLRIIGLDKRYDDYDNREARLVYRDNKMILRISKRVPKPEPYQPRDAIAMDINERKIVYGDDKIIKRGTPRSMKPIDGRSLQRISRRDTHQLNI